MAKPILSTDFKDLKLFKRGKVRDVYEVEDKLLIVSTDRISAFDVIFPNAIPDKGKVLNLISLFWFDFIKDIIPNHVVSSQVRDFPALAGKYKDILEGRCVLVEKTQVLPFECVVRGYLAGSAYKEYKEKCSVCGVALPPGLKESEKLPAPLFTPSTKEEHGHDINVDEKFMAQKLGADKTEFIKQTSLKIYAKAADYALTKGIIIADTKFEFGIFGEKIIIIDEVLTPDSSRFWPSASYKPGSSPASYDKQFVRDYLEGVKWNKQPPAPSLPVEVVDKTEKKYKEALKVLTGIILK